MAPAIKVGDYILKKKIGEGAFAEVRLATHAETGEEFAVKVFDRAALPRSDLENDVRREIKIMQYLRHPGIVSIHAALVTDTKMYLVMELVRGGELYDEIVSKKRVNEKTSRYYFQQLVDAMIYCHQRGVVHRDLKPENLLVTVDGRIKVCDFGMSWMKEIDSERATKQLLQTQCGTAKYMAPETIVRSGKGYDGEKVDAWECGMVLYALLAGYLPFNGEDDNSVFQSILRGKLKFPSHFSPGAKDILRSLLEKDPEKRMALPEARKHLWFLVDYNGDASQAALSKAAEQARPKMSPAPQKPKLAKSFKKNKSRSQLSQRIRNGDLKVNTDTGEGKPDITVVPNTKGRKSTVRFPTNIFENSRSSDKATEDQNVLAHREEEAPCQQPESFSKDGDASVNRESITPQSRKTDDSEAGELAVDAGISAIAIEDRTAATSDHQTTRKGGKKVGGANLLGMPSLGMLFSNKDSDVDSGMDTLTSPIGQDEGGGVSVKSRKKTPIASMFKSMLSTNSEQPSSAADVNNEGKLVAQSSWFTSSPMSDASTPFGVQQNPLDRMISEDDGNGTKVSSFRFLKRPAKKRSENNVI